MNFDFMSKDESSDPLKDFGRNLTDEAARNQLDPVIGRDEEIRRVIRILSRKTKNNPVLVGEPGVGKTAIVEGLAQKIVAGNVPENLKDKEIYEIDLPSMIAGASFQGQFEKRLKDLMNRIKESNGDIIVFIDEIHMLVGTGRNKDGGMDAAQIIKPMLARGEMRLIGATTLDEHKKYIETDAAFERRLQKVIVSEPTKEETITILRGIKENLERYHKVKIHDSAIIESVKLSSRYISDRFLPDKAIDLIDEAAAAIQTEMNSKPEELEKQEQKLMMLEMEKAALENEKENKADIKLSEIKDKIIDVQKIVHKLTKAWTSEKKQIQKIANIKSELESVKNKISKYQLDAEYEKAAQLAYKDLPELEKALDKANGEFKSNKSKLLKEDVSKEEIADIVSKWTNIPVTKLLTNQKSKLMNLENILKERVKGQDEAIKLISEAILISRADINDPDKPIGSFLFMGPTGVGKTELARTLSSELFDSEKHMIRLDMSEYMEKQSTAKLIGSPPGYVGFDNGGILTEAVRRKPYSIILFDEIEKAHPDVLNILLQIMDDGRLSDSKGRLINFKNTIIIMTSNLGSANMLAGVEKKEIIDEVKKYFKPEFSNRIDEMILFNPLNKEGIKEITKLELLKLENRLQEKEFFITFNKAVIQKVALDSFDQNYGARPIKRYIKKYIESPLAKRIIAGKIEKDVKYEGVISEDGFEYRVFKYN